MISIFLPENRRTLVDFECLPSYTDMQFVEITDTSDNVVIPRYGVQSGPDQIMRLLTNLRLYHKAISQSVLGLTYSIIRHHSGIYFMERNQQQNSECYAYCNKLKQDKIRLKNHLNIRFIIIKDVHYV